MPDTAIAVCETCGMPVRVIFDADGKIEKVLAVCGHVQTQADDNERGS
jgi:hypothetical protein